MSVLTDKQILITGGSGFLGRALSRALKERNRVTLVGRDADRLRVAGASTGCATEVADLTDIAAVRALFDRTKPEIVIHAAANKYVQASELDPFGAIDANVTTTQNVARAATERGVAAVLGISSNSAAPPCQNTYGLSKALTERLFCSLGQRKTTKFTTVRLGNIAWSTGSVFPVWQTMASKGGITSTGADTRRFFLRSEEAVATVLTALAHIDELSGSVLVRPLKAAPIRELLDLWVRTHGGSWKADDSPSDRADDHLIGDLEAPYTREVTYDGVRYYVISFNQKAEKPLASEIHTSTAPRYSEAELLQLIAAPAEL